MSTPHTPLHELAPVLFPTAFSLATARRRAHPLHHSAACPPPSSWMPRVCCQRVFAARADHISRENKLMFSTFFFSGLILRTFSAVTYLFFGGCSAPQTTRCSMKCGGSGQQPPRKSTSDNFFICEVGGCGTNCCCLLFRVVFLFWMFLFYCLWLL